MLNNLKLIYLLLRITLQPLNYFYIEKFRRTLAEQGYMKDGLKFVEGNALNHHVLKKKILFDHSTLTLEALKKFPSGSLGFEYARFLEQHGLKLVFFKDVVTDTAEGYFHRRVIETHDIWHVILGWPPDSLGEMKLQGFMYAQLRWPTAPFYTALALAGNMIKNLGAVPAIFAGVAEGWALGNRTPPLFAYEWEYQWDRPLSEIRRELGLEDAILPGQEISARAEINL